MSNNLQSNLCLIFTLLISAFSWSAAQAQTNPAISKMYGQVGVTTNYVDRGLTQSDKGPSLSAGLGYWFGDQGRIGFEASSVKYPGESASLEMRAFGEFKFVFTPNASLKVRDDLVRYVSEDRRNKSVINLDQNFFSYHILVSREDNFEGTKTARNWFAFQKDWELSTSFQLNAVIGYSMVENYDSYFDGLLGVTYFASNISLSLAATSVSNASQFNGQGDPAFIFTLAAKF